MTREEREVRSADRLANAIVRFWDALDERYESPGAFRGAVESLAAAFADSAIAHKPKEFAR